MCHEEISFYYFPFFTYSKATYVIHFEIIPIKIISGLSWKKKTYKDKHSITSVVERIECEITIAT